MLALRVRPARPLLVSFPVICLVGLQMLAFVPPLPVGAIMLAAAGAFGAISLANVLWETTVQEQVPREAISRVVAYDWLVSLVCMPLGYVLAGPVSAAIGIGATFAGCAALVVAREPRDPARAERPRRSGAVRRGASRPRCSRPPD